MKCIDVGSTLLLFASWLLLAGCDQATPTVGVGGSDSPAGHSHEHRSGHAHVHPHSHQQPLHGGRIVAIGHSHHGSEETHYHAEIMPVVDGKITFHVLTEGAAGQSQTVRVAAATIVAYVDPLDRDTGQALEVVFSSEGNDDTVTFVAAIPESLQDCKRLSVVVPKIELGGERLTFSFKTATQDAPALPGKTTGETST